MVLAESRQAVTLPEDFLSGDDIKTNIFPVAAGEIFKARSILGLTSTGELKVSDTSNGDGSEVPFAIAVHDYDETVADIKEAPVYVRGHFDPRYLEFGATAHTVTSIKGPLSVRGIELRERGYSE